MHKNLYNAALVSIIIPSYNAKCWIKEAIDSCLQQADQPVEIIVIDDGSTDNTLEILKFYSDKIILEIGPNRGGNYARNRGFALSKGEYVQFLDADDYILPKKIAHQVSFLEETKADVVYGDWRHQFHKFDGQVHFGDVIISQEQEDVLESLLAGWWVAPVALLFRRQAIINSGGWDETLKAAQDRDFFISVAMTGANIEYQPGCHSVYRRYGNVTVGTASKKRFFEQHGVVVEKAEKRLNVTGRLTSKYRSAIAASYFSIARGLYDYDIAKYHYYINKMKTVDPNFKPNMNKLYDRVQSIIGYAGADRIASLKRRYIKGSTL